MDLSFLNEADTVTLEMERAKRALESAKLAFETAKRNYDDLLGRADEMGIPKAKLKKLTEDRIQMLFDSGLLDFLEPGAAKDAAPKKASRPKKAKRAEASAEDDGFDQGAAE